MEIKKNKETVIPKKKLKKLNKKSKIKKKKKKKKTYKKEQKSLTPCKRIVNCTWLMVVEWKTLFIQLFPSSFLFHFKHLLKLLFPKPLMFART